MNATIINIGDELLLGQVVNSNAAVMAQMMAQAGFGVERTIVVGDNADDIRRAIDESIQLTPIVLITGGLGPTKDDITKHLLADYFGSELYENSEALATVTRIITGLGRPMTELNRRQAWVPKCCRVLNNDVGTAPCMWFDHPKGVIISMPGVPFEMQWLVQHRVLPTLAQRFSVGCIVKKNILIEGIGESFLSDLIEPWELALPKELGVAYLPVAGMVKLRLTARANTVSETSKMQSLIDNAVASLQPLAGKYIVGYDAETLEELVHRELSAQSLTLAAAESCTGGTIVQRLTALPGASAFLKGGVVAYCNEAKHHLLNVPQNVLDEHGAVSEPTVIAMAQGVRRQMNADYALATTGIAGPGGAEEGKPVGTVWVAIDSEKGTEAQLLHLRGERQPIVDRTVNHLFAMLLRHVRSLQ